MTPLIETDRVTTRAETSATDGRIVWAPAKSLWLAGHVAGGLAALIWFPSLGGLAAFVLLSAATLMAGHSVGMHRLLIHRSFTAPKWLARCWSGSARWWAWPGRLA